MVRGQGSPRVHAQSDRKVMEKWHSIMASQTAPRVLERQRHKKDNFRRWFLMEVQDTSTIQGGIVDHILTEAERAFLTD